MRGRLWPEDCSRDLLLFLGRHREELNHDTGRFPFRVYTLAFDHLAQTHDMHDRNVAKVSRRWGILRNDWINKPQRRASCPFARELLYLLGARHPIPDVVVAEGVTEGNQDTDGTDGQQQRIQPILRRPYGFGPHSRAARQQHTVVVAPAAPAASAAPPLVPPSAVLALPAPVAEIAPAPPSVAAASAAPLRPPSPSHSFAPWGPEEHDDDYHATTPPASPPASPLASPPASPPPIPRSRSPLSSLRHRGIIIHMSHCDVHFARDLSTLQNTH